MILDVRIKMIEFIVNYGCVIKHRFFNSCLVHIRAKAQMCPIYAKMKVSQDCTTVASKV